MDSEGRRSWFGDVSTEGEFHPVPLPGEEARRRLDCPFKVLEAEEAPGSRGERRRVPKNGPFHSAPRSPGGWRDGRMEGKRGERQCFGHVNV